MGTGRLDRWIGKPFPERAPAVTGVIAFGARKENMHGVMVTVDPDSEAVFSIDKIENPALR